MSKEAIVLPQVGESRLCLVCAYEKPWGIVDPQTGTCVCVDCRDARVKLEQVATAVKALYAERFYQNGQKEEGISVEFLMRMHIVAFAAGLKSMDDPFVSEALAYLKPYETGGI